MFNPKPRYTVNTTNVDIQDFVKYKEEYVTRPPYQRKNVWDRKHQNELLDSLFRRFYVPRIVLREVRLEEDHSVWEVIDGQQRITTAQRFLEDALPLPGTLADVHPELPGRRFSELPSDVRRFVDRSIGYEADIITGIDNPKNPEHQNVATEIFWRLQQGEPLTYMETAHARLSSLSRNFVVHYADDYRFDFDAYKPVDDNPDKHPFFRILSYGNGRMEHLALLTRFVILEENGGLANVQNDDVKRHIDRHQTVDGIDNLSFKDTPQARAVLANLTELHKAFANDPMLTNGGTVRELQREYIIISAYLLMRHLREHYAFAEAERDLFRRFVADLHGRLRTEKHRNTDILLFSDNRQQTQHQIAERQMIMRQYFFEYASAQGHEMIAKDTRRAFSELDRILIYRAYDGLCQECVREGKPEQECLVPWGEFDADHVVPHSRGGETTMDNAELLCRYHNRRKGAAVAAG